MNLFNKNIIVTGGAKGIGRSIVSTLHDKGANVVVIDIDGKALENIKTENTICYQCDVCDHEKVSNVINKISKHFPQIDGLVNNAGRIYSAPLINIMSKDKKHNREDWDNVLSSNLTSTFNVTSHVVEKMIEHRNPGVIVNMSSVSANGNPGQGAYSAAKAGVNALTKVWAKELGGFGIRTVAIAPGFVDTESTHNSLNENIIEDYVQKTPLKRLASVDDISQSVIFALENDHLTGEILQITGGLTL